MGVLHRSRWLSAVGLGFISLTLAAPTFAQSYSKIKPRVSDAESRLLAGRVASILRNSSAPSPEDLKTLDDFFLGNLYSAMTDDDPVKLGQLAEKREQLFQRYVNAAKSPAARDHLIAITMKAMGAISRGNYHPAVRYNAALVIGQLDQTPGKPLPAATEALVALLENDEINNVAVPTALKAAALIGLRRHVQAGVDPAMGERITKGAMAVATRKEMPEDASQKAYGWIRRQAAQLLTTQFAAGLTPPVHQSLTTLISDKTIDVDDCCGVAQLLKGSMYQDAQGLDVQAMALALGDLAKRVFSDESEQAEKFLDEILGTGNFGSGAMSGGFGRGGAMMGRGGFDGGMMDRGGMGGMNLTLMEELGPTYERRRMIDRALAIADGADAAAVGGSDELKEQLAKLSTAIRGVAMPAADKETVDETVADNVIALAKEINQIVGGWQPAAAEAEKEEASFEMPEEETPADGAAAEPAAAG